MSNITELSESRFLKKEDCNPARLLTIRECDTNAVISRDGKDEPCWVLFFEEEEKGLVLRSTNAQLVASVTGSQETNDWPGHKVVLYSDPTIQMKGKVVGGIRVRAPKKQVANAPRAVTPPPAPTVNDQEDPGDESY